MKLYYMTGACTLATKISLIEAGQKFEAYAVDRVTKRTADGKDYNAINPKGYVPTLVLDDGRVLTENVAVLSYVASLDPTHRLAPRPGDFGCYRLLEWLGFVNGELHKNMSPLFRADSSEEAKVAARAILTRRLAYVEESLGDKPYLMGEQFTVADAYLYVVLSWKARTGVDLSNLPRLSAYFERCQARPAVQQARQAEGLPP
jgi:glutathione S-transferase